MSTEIQEAFGQIAREKSLDRKELVAMIEAGLVAAAKKKFGANSTVQVELDPLRGRIDIFLVKRVTEEVTNEYLEMTPAEAQEIDPGAQLEGLVRVPVDISEFGRTAIQAAKQVVIQRVREAERERIHLEYSARIGELISGSVQQVERGNYIVFIHKQMEAILPVREQIKREHFKQGDMIRACLIDVQDTTKGPQLILSRTHPNFVKALFQLEVPEVAQGVVVIREIAREPGSRSKVSVMSRDENIDPVGACVGLKGSRVQAIVSELGGERIDIVPFNADPHLFVRKALAPALVQRTIARSEEKVMTVVVDEDQLSLAIGRAGQNVRLGSKLTGWKIDLITKAEWERERAEEEAAEAREQEALEGLRAFSLLQVPGIGEKTAANLKAAGFETLADLVDVEEDKLLAVPGIGPKTAERLLTLIRGALEGAPEAAAEGAEPEIPVKNPEEVEAEAEPEAAPPAPAAPESERL